MSWSSLSRLSRVSIANLDLRAERTGATSSRVLRAWRYSRSLLLNIQPRDFSCLFFRYHDYGDFPKNVIAFETLDGVDSLVENFVLSQGVASDDFPQKRCSHFHAVPTFHP